MNRTRSLTFFLFFFGDLAQKSKKPKANTRTPRRVESPYAQVSAGSGALETVGQFNEGEAFGEMSLLTGARRTASVRAAEDSWVLEVGRKGVEAVVRARPLLIDDFAKFIVDRQREGQTLDRSFADDETELSVWSAEQHQQVIEAIQAWILRGEQTAGTPFFS